MTCDHQLDTGSVEVLETTAGGVEIGARCARCGRPLYAEPGEAIGPSAPEGQDVR